MVNKVREQVREKGRNYGRPSAESVVLHYALSKAMWSSDTGRRVEIVDGTAIGSSVGIIVHASAPLPLL